MVKKVPELVLMVGLPGSGKTTMAHNVYDSHITLSSDKIREELFGDEGDQSDNKFVFDIMRKRVRNNLSSGNRVVCDATNLTKMYREPFIKIAEDCNANVIAHCMKVPLEECLRRNYMRDRQVPEDIIEEMNRTVEWPTLDEGFDEIRVTWR